MCVCVCVECETTIPPFYTIRSSRLQPSNLPGSMGPRAGSSSDGQAPFPYRPMVIGARAVPRVRPWPHVVAQGEATPNVHGATATVHGATATVHKAKVAPAKRPAFPPPPQAPKPPAFPPPSYLLPQVTGEATAICEAKTTESTATAHGTKGRDKQKGQAAVKGKGKQKGKQKGQTARGKGQQKGQARAKVRQGGPTKATGHGAKTQGQNHEGESNDLEILFLKLLAVFPRAQREDYFVKGFDRAWRHGMLTMDIEIITDYRRRCSVMVAKAPPRRMHCLAPISKAMGTALQLPSTARRAGRCPAHRAGKYPPLAAQPVPHQEVADATVQPQLATAHGAADSTELVGSSDEDSMAPTPFDEDTNVAPIDEDSESTEFFLNDDELQAALQARAGYRWL